MRWATFLHEYKNYITLSIREFNSFDYTKMFANSIQDN